MCVHACISLIIDTDLIKGWMGSGIIGQALPVVRDGAVVYVW